MNRKKLNEIAREVSRSMLKKVLAHAYMMAKSNNLSLVIQKIDGVTHHRDDGEIDLSRIKVVVQNGLVVKSTVG